MENKILPLTYWYGEALNNQDIHACTSMDLSTVHIGSLFEENNSLKFIKQYFDRFSPNSSKKNTSNKLSTLIGKITPFRAQHTVASFLLGIALKEELTLDIRNWVRLYDAHSSDPSFGFLGLSSASRMTLLIHGNSILLNIYPQVVLLKISVLGITFSSTY